MTLFRIIPNYAQWLRGWNCGVYLPRLPTVGDAKTHTMKTTVQISIAGVALEVEGFFTPAEPQTREDPGMSAEFEVESVTLVNRGDDIFELLTTCIGMEDIADAAMEALGQRETPDDYWGGF